MLERNFVNNPIVPGMKINSDAESVLVDETYYKKIVGSLMYLTTTRTSVRYATSLLNMYMERPTKLHLKFAKRVLKYLKGTMNLGIFYKRSIQEKELKACIDNDYVSDT